MYEITLEPVDRRCAGQRYKTAVDAPAGSIIKWHCLTAPTNVDLNDVVFEPQGARETYYTLPFVGDYDIYATVEVPKN